MNIMVKSIGFWDKYTWNSALLYYCLYMSSMNSSLQIGTMKIINLAYKRAVESKQDNTHEIPVMK